MLFFLTLRNHSKAMAYVKSLSSPTFFAKNIAFWLRFNFRTLFFSLLTFFALSLSDQAKASGFRLAGTYSFKSDGTATAEDSIYVIGGNGLIERQLLTGLSGLEFITSAPPGEFRLLGLSEQQYFFATAGGSANSDGTVQAVDLTGKTVSFLGNIDAVDIAFDTMNVLGGGMFVTDINDRRGAGKIWQVTMGGDGVNSPGVPAISNPDLFEVQLYADFAQFGRLKAFSMLITNGENGFLPGMYVTSGPSGDDRSDRIVYISPSGSAEVFATGFNSSEDLIMANSEYGIGMFVTQPLKQNIVRLLPDGTHTIFTSVGSAPFGPAGIVLDAQGLIIADYSSSSLLKIYPDGKSSLLASIPVPKDPLATYGPKSTTTLVPGPLPILGLGVTFSYARRLRKRSRQLRSFS